jgi:CrcB protein
MDLLLAILGGAVGAALRYFIEKGAFQAWCGDPFPWAALTVNFTGCFILGVLLGRATANDLPAATYILLGAAITTFRVFGHQLLELLRSGLHGATAL